MKGPVDLDVARADRAPSSEGITPETVLKAAIRDCEEFGDVDGCYITLIRRSKEGAHLEHYRANLNREQELAYRQLGVYSCMANWVK